ncbi:MAG: V-type ATP synthase subunit E [Candidatus Heimdallarchaeaceae archaeon]
MTMEQADVEITKKIEEKAEKKIKEILAEQKAEIAKIEKETEEKIAKLREKIIEEAKRTAERQFQKKTAKQDLEFKLKITKYRDELVEELLEKAVKELEKLTETEDYVKSLENLIIEAASTLKQKELILYCRKKDKKIFSKQFLEKISSKLLKESNIETTITLSNKHIDCLGGIILETSDGKISIKNTYEKRIERSLEELKRELSIMLTEKDDKNE